MLSFRFKIFFLIYILLAYCNVFSQQNVSLDWKMHNVGQVRQFVSNIGSLWPTGYLIGDFTGLIYCEFPPNSHEEHVGEGGIWVGAIAGKDTLVSVTTSWHSSVEFFPSAARDDTIWVVNKGDTVDIPYWPKYVAVSDQDFVCRYNDYNLRNIALHTPLYVDVIQTSYAYSSPPLDEMIIFNYYVIPTRNDLEDVYIAYWLDGNVGYRGEGWSFALDDLSLYYPEQHLGVSYDAPGFTDGDAISPIGIKIYPPKNTPASALKWTFNWVQNPDYGPPSRDPDRYLEMSSGVIMKNQQEAVGSQFFLTFGPVDLTVGDTLHFVVGEILGTGLDGLLDNSGQLDWLISNDFHVPSPPPRPPLRIETQNHQVILRWAAQPGDVNPETYQDPYRADSSKVPFEGYRIYKSTGSPTGPWNLLAEYDLPANAFNQNTGLEHEYIDVGLLNNLEYYYSVSAFSKPDTKSRFPSLESSINANAQKAVPGTAPPSGVGSVAVVPNPYRGDIAYHSYNPPWEKPDASRERWMEQDRKILFINLPVWCEIQIYTLAGDWVNTILHDNAQQGFAGWNLTSAVGQAIASGIYLFTIKDLKSGAVQIGKFVIIK
ncbi:hypothetical protein L0128_15885 [candidate division KSB1 bacterium]|nr:hypothetical protein [candidate division KSB1 bacterium]